MSPARQRLSEWERKNCSDIKRGKLSEKERSEIERLATASTKVNVGKIARRINRNRGTVFWFLLRRGYLSRTLRYQLKPYMRAGKMIYPFAPEEDRRALELRRTGLSAAKIAAILRREGWPDRRSCSGHAVAVRLEFLAAYENSPEEIAA